MQLENTLANQAPEANGVSDGSAPVLPDLSAHVVKAPRKRPWLRVLRAAVSVGLLGYVLYATLTHQGVDALLERLREVRPLWLLLACVFPCLAVILGAIRWGVLLREEGLHLPLSWLLRHMLIGRFVGAFTPSTTGLDGYRLLAVTRKMNAGVAASRAMVLEKVAGLAGLAAIT
ncbi:MAG TPA: lysylphosphatidylglycerol synthase transmembrane domain-containing protein, partial [Flavobacteriales bacterium]|nr:lysylphosphatidylglycerol synthase transmembrane domain-containing protein [Flavobacteriales bacterium]